MRDRIVFLAIVVMALGLAIVAAGGLLAGVPADDPWLFPMLVVLPALAAAALALSLRARPATRANIAVLTIAIVIGLYIVETVLALLSSQPAQPSGPSASAGGAIDPRTRFEVVADLRAAGTAAYPSFGARGLRVLNTRDGPGIAIGGQRIAPLAQLMDRTIVDCNESGQFAVFRTDERGFNNPPGLWSQAIDVAAVGDSYIQGSCVDPAQTLVAAMRRQVPATLGAGIPDSGPLTYLGIIREYLSVVRPRAVVWFHYEGNDLRNLANEYLSAEMRLYLQPDASQRLFERQSAIDSVIAGLVDAIIADPPVDAPPPAVGPSVAVAVRRWIRLSHIRTALALGNVNDRLQTCCDLEVFEATLVEARRTVEAWGGRLHFVYLPAAGRYFHPSSALLDDDLRYRGRVLRVVRDLGLPLLDIHATYRAAGNPTRFFFSDRSHYNPDGYRVVGDAVVAHLGSAP